MEDKGIQIKKRPRCGNHGLLIERLTVTTNGNKKYTHRKLNVVHYAGYGISRNGKPVDRIHWCYLNVEQLKELQESGVRQTFVQNVTQTVRQNENQDLGFFSGNDGSPGEIRTPVGGSKARHACPLQSAERFFLPSTGLLRATTIFVYVLNKSCITFFAGVICVGRFVDGFLIFLELPLL